MSHSDPSVPCVDLTLVLVSYHSRTPLERFFQSCDRHPIGASHEIIVIDNAPGDGVGEWLARERPTVSVVPMQRNVGYAGAVNEGLARGRGRYFLVINPDVEVGEGGIDLALDYMRQHPEVGILGARLLNSDGTIQQSARRFYTLTTLLLRRTPLGRLFKDHPALRRHLMLDDDLSRPGPVDWVMGAWMLVRREAVERAGPMDDRFFLYFEDVDWCYRMWSAGFEVHYLPDASFVHQYQRSSGRMGRSLLHHLRSFLSFSDKWGVLAYVARRLRGGWETVTAVLLDVVLVNAAFLAAFSARRALDPLFPEPLYDLADYLPLQLFVNVVGAVVLPLLGRYRRHQPVRPLARWLDSSRAALVLGLVVMVGTFLAHTQTFSRAVILLLVPFTVAGLELSRVLRRRLLGGGSRLGTATQRALLLGTPAAVERLQRLLGEGAADMVIVGAATPAAEAVGEDLRLLGEAHRALELVERYHATEVLLDGTTPPEESCLAAAVELAVAGVDVLLAHPWAAAVGEPEARMLAHGVHWLRLRPPAGLRDTRWLKELFDRLGGAVLCLSSAPGFVLCWLWGRMTRRWALEPMLLLGRGRTTLRWNEWVTRASGRPLPGLVQLPLFVQVLRGHLSLVGPLPLPAGYEEELSPFQLLRFAVKPGLIGPWRWGHDSALSGVRDWVRNDVEYIERWSPILDLDLFLTGVPRLLLGRSRWPGPSAATGIHR